jgi:nucleoid DNA-binding protein
MTSIDFVKKVAENTGLSQRVVRSVFKASEDALQDALVRGESLKAMNLNFSTKEVAAHTGRNPSTGETVEVPAYNRIVVKPSVSLKNAVKEGRLSAENEVEE